MLTPAKAFTLLFVLVILSACNRQSSTRTANINLPGSLSYNDSSVIVFPASEDSGLFRNGLNKKSTQHFIVKHNKTSLIRAAKGLQVKIDPDALEREDGLPITGDIAVEILELTNSDDLFKNNAATVSDGKLLISGGSYFIAMESGSAKLKIKKGKALEMEFPVINEKEMELFYGRRNDAGDMNWVSAGKPLQQQWEDIKFNRQQDYPGLTPPRLKIRHHLFKSVKDKLYYNNRLTTLEDMVKQLQARGLDRIIDTVYYSWTGYGDGGNNVVYSRDSMVKTGTFNGYQLRLISQAASIAEKDSMHRANEAYRCALKEFNDANASLASSLKKYYAPALIGELGWINCDRFYDNPNPCSLELELPITMCNSRVSYFIIFRNFSGLLNGQLDLMPAQPRYIQNLPLGEKVTVVAFTKSQGLLYRFSRDITIEKNQKLELGLKPVSEKELKKMFGAKINI